MKNKIIYTTLIIIALVTVFLIILNKNNGAKSPKDAIYMIGQDQVRIGDKVKYFGNEVTHDFDKDGRNDIAFIITQTTGGSGTFYYLVVALNTIDRYVGSQGFFLGDRIAPQTTEMGKGNIIIVNYADRKLGESFTTAPSMAKSIWALLDVKTMQMGEVMQNFEGESR